ncbi:MAG: amidohydrolase family protein, partial [Dehalococcoidia bacterium]|nr:amidohydrolase family protein [Dehalococcoidia bacterium]
MNVGHEQDKKHRASFTSPSSPLSVNGEGVGGEVNAPQILPPSIRITLEETKALIQVAQGRLAADLYLRGGQVVNVYSGEVLPANVAIRGRRIAYVGALDTMVGPETQVLNAKGYYLLPGFIDPHGHSDYFYTSTELARAVLPGGTTTIFGDCLPTYSILDPADFETFLKGVTRLPLKFFFGVRAEPPTFWDPQQEDLFTEEHLARILGHPEILGMTEYTSWYRTFSDMGLVRKLQMVREMGKRVEGHLAGCPYERINSLVDAGITSCHESITAEEALDRLRLGLWVILRESSIRHDLKELSRLITEYRVHTSRLMLTPDGPVPVSILKNGYIDHLLRLAISYGTEPMTAIQMVTINPATYLGLDEHLGGIAPGRIADIVMVRDLSEPRAEVVVADGQVAARDGEMLIDLPVSPWYERAHNKYNDQSSPFRDIQPGLFRIPVGGAPQPFPVIELVNGIITRRVNAPWHDEGGYVAVDPALKATKVALIIWNAGKVVNGFLTRMGASFGGFATTMNVAKELLVIGENED